LSLGGDTSEVAKLKTQLSIKDAALREKDTEIGTKDAELKRKDYQIEALMKQIETLTKGSPLEGVKGFLKK
jgi:uncharacterized protein involved in exopolysaccharide biosynthesis